MQSEIISNKSISSQLNFITFINSGLEFSPGDNIELGVNPNGPFRVYSLCGLKLDKTFSVFYKVIEGGAVSSVMTTLKPGDSLYVRNIISGLDFKKVALGSTLLVSNGTGIAPFLSWIFSESPQKITLIHGCHDKSEVPKLEELSEKCDLVLCTSVSESQSAYRRVGDYLEKSTITGYDNYYLCGSARMISDTASRLLNQGVPNGKINFEVFY